MPFVTQKKKSRLRYQRNQKNKGTQNAAIALIYDITWTISRLQVLQQHLFKKITEEVAGKWLANIMREFKYYQAILESLLERLDKG